jgi:hypothetical protein
MLDQHGWSARRAGQSDYATRSINELPAHLGNLLTRAERAAANTVAQAAVA